MENLSICSMNVYANKKNMGKALALVAVVAMMVCAFALVMPATESDAATSLPQADQGTYTLTEATYGTDTAPIVMNATTSDVKFELGTDVKSSSVFLTFNGTTDGANLFSTGTLTVDGAITIHISITGDEGIKTVRALHDMNVTLTNGATVEITSAESIQCQSWWNETSTYGTLTLGTKDSTTDVGGHLILNSAGGFSGVKASLYGQSSVEAKNTEVAAMNFATLDVGEKASVKVQDGTATYINFAGAVTNNGTIDAGASYINMNSGATLNNTATGKVNASEIKGDAAKDAITNAGTLSANVSFGDAETGFTYISGVVKEDTLVSGDAILENVTVNPGVTLSVADSGNATVKGDMRLYGTIAPATKDGAATITVGTDASLTAYNGASVAKGMKVISEGNGKVDLSAAMSTVTLNDDIESDFNASQSQKVVIADTLTIKSGYKMTVLGELVINEGCTVIIEDGAELVLGDETNKITATGMTVNGTIEVEVGGLIDVQGAKDVIVNGTIASSGTVEINSTVTVKNGGRIVIDDYQNTEGIQQSEIVVKSGLTIENGGELSVAGNMTIDAINNEGTITLNGANIVKKASVINMTASGAVVDIKSMTQAAGMDLTINDARMYLYTDDTDEDVEVLPANASSIVFNADDTKSDVGVRNIKITAAVTSEKVDKDTTKYVSSLVLSGSVTILDNTANGDFNGTYAINITGNVNKQSTEEYTLESTIEVPESLTIGKNIILTLEKGVMNVDGTITATAAGSQIVSGGTNTGEIYVNGMITIGTDNKAITDGINAFNYDDEDYVYYTTLKTAVDNGATDIEYIGNVKVLDTLTLPADTELSKATNGGKITIGDEDNRDVIVTVADGATVRGCTIDVMATLVFDNNKTGNRTTNVISSDVIIDAEPKRTYTNIYTALEDAADNSTISISRNIFLDKDAEVRATVTLEIVSPYGVYLDNGVTLTVNGTVKNGGSIGNAVDDGTNQPSTTGMLGFDPEVDDHAAIVVSGTVMSMEKLAYDTYYIVGAYYQLVNDQGSWYYITPVEAAATASNDVEKGAIDIYGENTVGDVSFTGDADQNVFVTVYGTLNAGTVTLDEAAIVVAGSFTGTAATENGTVDIENAKMLSVSNSTVDDAAVTYLAGTPVAADVKKDSSVAIATGTVNIQNLIVGIMEMSKETPSIFEDTGLTAADEDVDSFAIASGATAVVSGEGATLVAGKMTVDGTLNVTEKGAITVDELTVRGTLNVASEDKENDVAAGSASIETLFVGIAKKTDKAGTNYFGDASAAAVTADEIKTLANIYVSAESTITGDLTEKMNTTQFFVEDALWMTIYTTEDDMAIDNSIQPGDLVNSEFSYWTDADGNKIDTSSDVDVGDVGYETVYATLNYNIYTVTVFADPGINAVYIDGQLMPKGYFETVDTAGNIQQVAGFQLKVTAGTHEITYKLNNYFSGEANMTVNGTAVSGNTFTTSGTTTADKNVTIYLQGIDASAPETPSIGGSDNGMGLTDYLLIILVVLIVVMAIMVAMRLMRS